MTEEEWVVPRAMLDDLRGQASRKGNRRRLRLFACACCRLLWEQITDDIPRRAVEVAERFADGLANAAELAESADPYEAFLAATPAGFAARGVTFTVAWDAAHTTAMHALDAGLPAGLECDLLRDIFPGRRRRKAPSAWKTSTVLSLAQQMYDSRDFSAMPILADAVEEAGCADPHILEHCRGEGPHVRGCWVVDLLLGQE